MVLAKVVASIPVRRQSTFASTLTLLAMTVSTGGLIHAQAHKNQPSLIARSNATGSQQVDSTAKMANYGKLPLSFAANQGQSVPQVRFTSRGSGYSLFLTDSEAVLALSKPDGSVKAASPSDHGLAKSTNKPRIDVVRMQLAGAKPGLQVLGEEKLPGTANYFIGNDASKWHTDVPTYSRVKYAGIYPGVDLVYYGNQQQLEYDFVVAPGVDPKQIKLHFDGAKLSLNAHGDLMVTGKYGEVSFEKPVVYQIKGGSPDEREPVSGRFTLLAANTVGFSLGSYDSSRTVIIDPILAYSTYLGGSGTGYYSDYANGIAVDASGTAYVTGITYSTDFPVTGGAYQTTNGAAGISTSNAFVTRLNSTGTALDYSTYLGGTNGIQYGQIGHTGASGDAGLAIAVDTSGQAYVTGVATSTNFPTTPGALQTVSPDGKLTAFVTKLSSRGNSLVYSTYLGGPNEGYTSGIAVDASGQAYVTGRAYSTGFPVTTGAFQTVNRAPNGGLNAFVTKLNSLGSALVYSTYLGGSLGSGDYGSGIAVDASGDAYVIGSTSSEDFPVTPGAFQSVNNSVYAGLASQGGNHGLGGNNVFVTKLNSSGTALEYSTYLGGTYADYGNAIAIDASGNAYVTGDATSSDFPVTPGAFQPAPGERFNYPQVFVTKLNPNGTALKYSTYLGGGGQQGDSGNAIAVDALGNAYVTGSTSSQLNPALHFKGFPTTLGAFQTANPTAGNDAFLTKLNATGTALAYSTYLGSPVDGAAAGYGVALDMNGNAYVTGSTSSSTYPVTMGAFQKANKAAGQQYAASNGFVTKFALGQPIALFSTTLETFPNAEFNSSSAPPVELVTVTNVGGGTLNFTTAIDAANYKVLTDGRNTCTSGVTASQSCSLPVEFDPAGVGTHTNTLTLTPASGIGASISLRGTATGIGDASESPLNFGSIAYGTTKTLPLTIANFGVAGSPTVAVSFNNASYSLASGGTCVTTGVASGQTCTVMIRFSPVGHGVHNAGIILTPSPSSGAAASIVPVLGIATTP